MGDQLQALEQVRGTAIELAMRFGPKLLVAILILVAGAMVGCWVGCACWSGCTSNRRCARCSSA